MAFKKHNSSTEVASDSTSTCGVRSTSLRKLVCAAVASACLALGTTATAATIFGVQGSAHIWQPELSGDIGQAVDAFDFSTEFDNVKGDSMSLLVAVEHPIPLIPNVQVRTTPIEWAGSSESASGTLLGVISFDGQVDAEFDLTALDGTLYYELLDNWVTLDLGVTARQLDGYVEVTESNGGASDRVEIDQVLPMLYGHARFDLPFSGLAAGVRGNIIAYKDNNLADLEAYLHLEADLLPLVDIGIQGGIRRLSLQVDDIDDWQSDAVLEGVYIALTGEF